jgi:NADH-quinone oxidoreductase subunit J
MSIAIVILGVICALLSINMLLAKSPITAAISLLGILVMTAGIYGLSGEHLIATIQLVVYAGAIMVLFVFSIMLLNLNYEDHDYKNHKGVLFGAVAAGVALFGLISYALNDYFVNHHGKRAMGEFSQARIQELGGNSKVLSHALFSQYYVSFEVLSIALLIAVVGAVVLAKRKFD